MMERAMRLTVFTVLFLFMMDFHFSGVECSSVDECDYPSGLQVDEYYSGQLTTTVSSRVIFTSRKRQKKYYQYSSTNGYVELSILLEDEVEGCYYQFYPYNNTIANVYFTKSNGNYTMCTKQELEDEVLFIRNARSENEDEVYTDIECEASLIKAGVIEVYPKDDFAKFVKIDCPFVNKETQMHRKASKMDSDFKDCVGDFSSYVKVNGSEFYIKSCTDDNESKFYCVYIFDGLVNGKTHSTDLEDSLINQEFLVLANEWPISAASTLFKCLSYHSITHSLGVSYISAYTLFDFSKITCSSSIDSLSVVPYSLEFPNVAGGHVEIAFGTKYEFFDDYYFDFLSNYENDDYENATATIKQYLLNMLTLTLYPYRITDVQLKSEYIWYSNRTDVEKSKKLTISNSEKRKHYEIYRPAESTVQIAKLIIDATPKSASSLFFDLLLYLADGSYYEISFGTSDDSSTFAVELLSNGTTTSVHTSTSFQSLISQTTTQFEITFDSTAIAIYGPDSSTVELTIFTSSSAIKYIALTADSFDFDIELIWSTSAAVWEKKLLNKITFAVTDDILLRPIYSEVVSQVKEKLATCNDSLIYCDAYDQKVKTIFYNTKNSTIPIYFNELIYDSVTSNLFSFDVLAYENSAVLFKLDENTVITISIRKEDTQFEYKMEKTDDSSTTLLANTTNNITLSYDQSSYWVRWSADQIFFGGGLIDSRNSIFSYYEKDLFSIKEIGLMGDSANWRIHQHWNEDQKGSSSSITSTADSMTYLSSLLPDLTLVDDIEITITATDSSDLSCQLYVKEDDDNHYKISFSSSSSNTSYTLVYTSYSSTTENQTTNDDVLSTTTGIEYTLSWNSGKIKLTANSDSSNIFLTDNLLSNPKFIGLSGSAKWDIKVNWKVDVSDFYRKVTTEGTLDKLTSIISSVSYVVIDILATNSSYLYTSIKLEQDSSNHYEIHFGTADDNTEVKIVKTLNSVETVFNENYDALEVDVLSTVWISWHGDNLIIGSGFVYGKNIIKNLNISSDALTLSSISLTGTDIEWKIHVSLVEAGPTYGMCIQSCIGLQDGSYQACGLCGIYQVCESNVMSTVPCEDGKLWDDEDKSCKISSTTCDEELPEYKSCDVNHCSTDKHDCLDYGDKFKLCKCQSGYYGKDCFECQNGGNPLEKGWPCACTSNYIGKYCEIDVSCPVRDKHYSRRLNLSPKA